MPKRAVVSCASGQWVRLTDAPVVSATFQNRSADAVLVDATVGETAPVGETGLRYRPNRGEGSERSISALFPSAIGAGVSAHLWALGPEGATIWIEHE